MAVLIALGYATFWRADRQRDRAAGEDRAANPWDTCSNARNGLTLWNERKDA